MIKALSWNYRGLGLKEKVEMVRHLIEYEKPHLLLLQETKKQTEEVLKITNLMWKICKSRTINAAGTSGIIFTLWDP